MNTQHTPTPAYRFMGETLVPSFFDSRFGAIEGQVHLIGNRFVVCFHKRALRYVRHAIDLRIVREETISLGWFYVPYNSRAWANIIVDEVSRGAIRLSALKRVQSM